MLTKIAEGVKSDWTDKNLNNPIDPDLTHAKPPSPLFRDDIVPAPPVGPETFGNITGASPILPIVEALDNANDIMNNWENAGYGDFIVSVTGANAASTIEAIKNAIATNATNSEAPNKWQDLANNLSFQQAQQGTQLAENIKMIINTDRTNLTQNYTINSSGISVEQPLIGVAVQTMWN